MMKELQITQLPESVEVLPEKFEIYFSEKIFNNYFEKFKIEKEYSLSRNIRSLRDFIYQFEMNLNERGLDYINERIDRLEKWKDINIIALQKYNYYKNLKEKKLKEKNIKKEELKRYKSILSELSKSFKSLEWGSAVDLNFLFNKLRTLNIPIKKYFKKELIEKEIKYKISIKLYSLLENYLECNELNNFFYHYLKNIEGETYYQQKIYYKDVLKKFIILLRFIFKDINFSDKRNANDKWHDYIHYLLKIGNNALNYKLYNEL